MLFTLFIMIISVLKKGYDMKIVFTQLIYIILDRKRIYHAKNMDRLNKYEMIVERHTERMITDYLCIQYATCNIQAYTSIVEKQPRSY